MVKLSDTCDDDEMTMLAFETTCVRSEIIREIPKVVTDAMEEMFKFVEEEDS